jgi:hypothetical protein
MAFTESQKLTIAEILGITYIELTDKIFYLGTDNVTTEVESQIISQIALWNEVKDKYSDFTPTESNEGLNLRSQRARDAVKKSVALKLYFTEIASGVGQTVLSRG